MKAVVLLPRALRALARPLVRPLAWSAFLASSLGAGAVAQAADAPSASHPDDVRSHVMLRRLSDATPLSARRFFTEDVFEGGPPPGP